MNSYLQYVTERAGKADSVTEYDSEYETLCTQLDQIKVATEHTLTQVETVVEPNPSQWSLLALSQPSVSVLCSEDL